MLENKKMTLIGDNSSSFVQDLYMAFKGRFKKVNKVFYLPPFPIFKQIKIWLVFMYHYIRSDIVFLDFMTTYTWIMLKIRKILPFHRIIVARCHRFEAFDFYERHKMRFEYILNHIDFIICVSHFTYNRINEINPNFSHKILIVHNGVDIELFCPKTQITHNFLRIGSMGNLIPLKRFESLIKSVASLIGEKGLKITLSIAGEGELKDDLDELIKSLKVRASIRLDGFIKNRKSVCYWFNFLDLFVLNSNVEGHPLVVLEAMACGLPVIATNVDDLEYVLDKDFLYEVDDPEEPKRSIKKMYSLNSDQLEKIGKRNRNKVVTNFNASVQHEKIINKLEELFENG